MRNDRQGGETLRRARSGKKLHDHHFGYRNLSGRVECPSQRVVDGRTRTAKELSPRRGVGDDHSPSGWPRIASKWRCPPVAVSRLGESLELLEWIANKTPKGEVNRLTFRPEAVHFDRAGDQLVVDDDVRSTHARNRSDAHTPVCV